MSKPPAPTDDSAPKPAPEKTPEQPRLEGNEDAFAHASFQRLGARIADLSKEISAITQVAGQAAPRKLELEAAASAFRSLAESYAADPVAFARAQTELFNRQSETMRHLTEGGPPPKGEGRFGDAAWVENPFFDLVRRVFDTSSQWAEQLAWDAPGLSETERRRAAFFIRQATSAMSPANSLVGNPRALKAMFASDGQSIRDGFANLQHDFDAGQGRINVTQTDETAFELGVSLAVTPGEVVLKNPLIELIRYHATKPQVFARPLVIFPPWINKYYVLDLTPANSLVAWLRDQGFTVYMVSWRSADDVTRGYDWDDYLRLGGRAALDWIHDAHKQPVNAAGYCVGGALLSVMAARMAVTDDKRLASISLLAAQTDFSEPGDLGLFIDAKSLDGVGAIIQEAGGVMPGEAMRDAFNALRPDDLIWRYVEERYLLGQDPKPFDLLYWNGDQTNLPGPLHLSSLKKLYIENALALGQFVVEGAKIDLGAITIPTFIHAARKDHISPFGSVYKGAHLFGGEVEFVLADSGHIAGVVNPPAAGKYRYWTAPDVPGFAPETANGWMSKAVEHAGSWWPLWSEWLAANSGAKVKPPAPIAGSVAAPGEYVRETLAGIRAKRG